MFTDNDGGYRRGSRSPDAPPDVGAVGGDGETPVPPSLAGSVMKSYGWRDRIVIAVANFVLRFGSRHLQDMLAGTIVFGLSMAKQEAEVASRTGRPPTATERDTMRRHAWHQR